MSWSLAAILLASVALGVVAAVYFFRRLWGKSYLAVSTISTIAALWTFYASLLSANWPNAIVALVLNAPREQVLAGLEPSWITIVGAAPVVCFLSWLIYRIASVAIAGNKFPTNASAREIEEPGGSITIIQLASAHIGYTLRKKADRPLNSPGEDPYRLPDIKYNIDWPNLAADLLTQFEPNLIRDTFSYIHERQFFVLLHHNVFDTTSMTRWVVYPGADGGDDSYYMTVFDKYFYDPQGQAGLKFFICIPGASFRDSTMISPRGLSIRILSQASLIQGSLNFSQYVSSLLVRFEQRHLPGSDYSLRECFVPLAVKELIFSKSPSGNIVKDYRACGA